MTNQSLTPPPELVQEWLEELDTSAPQDVLLAVVQWGADQELEACLRYAGDNGLSLSRMRAARRPKAPSLKEQALTVLDHTTKGWGLAEVDLNTIRRALEALPE
jgi:hypothetical protein